MSKKHELLMACEDGYHEIVKHLLADSKINLTTANCNSAIRLASQNGHMEVVKLLLVDPRVDPSDDSNFAIRSASENGHPEVVKLLIQDPRVDPSADNNYAIRWASENNHHDVVGLLLQHKSVATTAEQKFLTHETKQQLGLSQNTKSSAYAKLLTETLEIDHNIPKDVVIQNIFEIVRRFGYGDDISITASINSS